MSDETIHNRAVIVSSFFVCPRTNSALFLKSEISDVIYFPGTHPTQTATVVIYICLHLILSLRMSSTEMSPTRAFLAAESAAELPLMPTWPGTQINTIFFPSLVSFM